MDEQKFDIEDFLEDKMGNEKIEKTRLERPLLDENVNEYITKNMSTLAFPQLFPWGENCVFDDIPGVEEKNQPSQIDKLKRLVKFREIENEDDDLPRNRFAEHDTYLYWVYNRIQRQESRKNTKLFFKG